MRQRILPFVVIVLFALLSTVAGSQPCGGPGVIKNVNREISPPSGTAGKRPPSFPRPNWTVKYDSGSPGLERGQWLKIAFVPRLDLAQIANPSTSVQAEQLVRVEFNDKAEEESHLLQGPRSGCSYAHSMMPDTAKSPRPNVLVAAGLALGPVSRLAERLNHKHPVRFVWTEAGEEKSMVVKVNDCEYQSFIANIRWLVAARWPEVGRDVSH